MKIHLQTERPKRNWLRVAFISIGLLIVLVIGLGLFLTHRYKTNTSPQAQVQTLVSEVGKLMQLPTNEQPTIATVSNQATVSKQAFFINAKDGDKVLLYSKNKLAILYRPGNNKIINVGPINGTLSYAHFSVAIRNGTTNSQFAGEVNSQLSASFPYSQIVEKAAASRDNFPSTIVIAINSADDDIAAQIATSIGGQVGILPIGEQTPKADILIIIGQDYSN